MQTVSRLIQNFTPEQYQLSLEIDRTNKTFTGTVTINGISHVENELRLHAKSLTIKTVVIDGKTATWTQTENDELLLKQPEIKPGKHIAVLGFSGIITDAMHGMYPCNFEHGGKKKQLIATQFESHHAREVFPCVDEPEAKAIYDVTLTTEKGVTVLGNMPVRQQRTEDGKLVTTFERTPRMSSYLLAWVVGELHKKTAKTKSGVEVNVWATPAQSSESLDFALQFATRTIDFFDEYFGVAYPLPKSDHVALPDLSSGAMENWGLITYREVALLADPKTTSISNRRYIAMVVAHELSHQWFGNLVTMKWWNNLWLNESFANLMEYIAVDALHPEWNIWLDYSSSETIMALRRDALDGVQAVQTEVNHPDEISTLFDGAIVYAKGGRLLRMLQHYIGHDAFRAGLQSYFKKYAYQNTEGDDLWHELSTASGKDIAGFMNDWISQPGYPVVHVEENGLRQEQFFVGTHQASNRRWPIPLGASSSVMPPLMETSLLATTIEPGERLNVGDTAHFITHYPTDYLTALVEQVRIGSLEAIDRLQLLHEQTMLARGAISPSAELIPLLEAYKHEQVESVWDIIALALGELKKFVETDKEAETSLRELSRHIAEREYKRLGWQAEEAEPETDSKLRAIILSMTLYGEEKSAIDKAHTLFRAGVDTIDPELRSLITASEVRHFETPELIDSLIERYRTTPSSDLQMDICAGITSTRNPKTIQKLLLTIKDPSIVRAQDVFRWFVSLIRGRESRVATWQWMKENWEWIETTYAGDKSFDDFPRYAATGLITQEQLEDYQAFFAPMQSIPALKRVIQLGIAEIAARVELIDRDAAAVRRALFDLE
ncbi:aminopeptidase N, nonfunctional [Candidatus Saccharibacteria bacterium RAAC3_TM7_1]|nr:aminopeptidase N, nonfunctional [Candidatus Saccharibacteria bacterium RAAC3_TM7_1]